MTNFSEDTLKNWIKPPSDTEEEKLSNAEKMVKEAINADDTLSKKTIEIFGQGSYANNTNVRLNSDIDINVQFQDGFYFELPEGTTRDDFDFGEGPAYSFTNFKDDVYKALSKKFGEGEVKRKNKCITVLGNSNRVETDVVPTWEHRRYSKDGNYIVGAEFWSDKGETVQNFPKTHIENGKYKNTNTQRRFKRLTRIYRKARYKMIEEGELTNDGITSFLLECLVWNVPNTIFNNHHSWTDRLEKSIIHLYEETEEHETCKNWGEVSEYLYLFVGRKWTREDVNKYLVDMWNYLGF